MEHGVSQGTLSFDHRASTQLKECQVDNCYIDGPNNNAPKDPRSDFPTRFGAMQNALSSVGIKGMLVCQWGVPYTNSSGLLYGPYAWAPPLSTSYRVSDDIARGWNNVMRIYNQQIHVAVQDLTGPGQFADMDLLEVGNPDMTITEQATHFAMWAFLKSPLLISTRLEVCEIEYFLNNVELSWLLMEAPGHDQRCQVNPPEPWHHRNQSRLSRQARKAHPSILAR